MMAVVTIHEAKTQLETVIARGKEPVARLEAIASRKAKRAPGRLAGKFNIPDEFLFDALPKDELRRWEGRL